MPAKHNHLVISALGKDRPGIIDELSKAIYDLDCNITDSRMTVLGGEFAILLLVDGQWNQLAKLEDQVPELEERLALTIITRRTEPRAAQRHAPALCGGGGVARSSGHRPQSGPLLLRKRASISRT